MSVTLEHDGAQALAVSAVLARAPWSTCPDAVARCEQTFTGVALPDFPARREQKAHNCTHLYDLALLAAAHAHDVATLVYDVYVSDPVEGERRAEIRRDGERVLDWRDKDYRVIAPDELAGLKLMEMRAWIESLDADRQEAARILQWASLIAHGRTIPLAEQSDASRMPPTCYTFQPEQAVRAQRVGKARDFSDGSAEPLEFVDETV